jgi:hypothetical protein
MREWDVVLARAAGTFAAALLVPSLVAGCTAIRPAELSGGQIVARRPFSHEEYAPVLRSVVDAGGRVDYGALRAHPEALERYYFLLSKYSPDSHPEFFPTEADRKAYWLNAYNAVVLKTVIAHDPVSSVTDIRPWFPLSLLPGKSGFFLFQKVTLGGKTTNLCFLKNRVIRKRFGDPRVHFALSSASLGGPRLPRKPFVAALLDEQLDEAARAFVAEERNVKVDDAARVVYLSSIFDWYRGDFITWYENRFPGKQPTLLRYVALYASDEQAKALERAAAYEVRFRAYDWRLDDHEDVP